MKRFNLSGPQDIMALLVRRKWWIVFPFIGLSCAVVLLAYILPKMYVSQSSILITPRDVPKDFVKDLISGSAAQRVTTIQQLVLSRTSLNQVIDEYKDDFPEYQKLDIEKRASKLRSQIEVKFNTETVGHEELPLTYFNVSYQNRDPRMAQRITAKLTDLFITEDNRNRENQVNETVTFLEGSLEKLGTRLKDSDTRVKELKERRGNSLPDQVAATVTKLATLDGVRRSDQNSRDEAKSRLSGVERDLAITSQYVPKPAAPVIAVPIAAENPKIAEYKNAMAELARLQARYTDSFAPVILAKETVDRLRKELTPEQLASVDRKEEKTPVTAPVAETMLNPAYQNLLRLQEQAKNDLDRAEKNLKDTQDTIAKNEKILSEAPKSEQDIAEVVRENGDLNKQYLEMKNKLSEAQLSESAENSEKGSQFKVIDTANLPLSPTRPSKSVIAGAGMMVSLFVGLALAFIIDIANQKMWTLADVESILGTSVLVEIPEIVTAADLLAVRRRKIKQIISTVVIASAYGVCLYLVYIHQGFFLRSLEPLIQRFY